MRIFPSLRGLRKLGDALPLLVLSFYIFAPVFAAPETKAQQTSAETVGEKSGRRGLITDNGWLTFAGGISPWAALKANNATINVPDMQGSGKDFAFEFRFNYPIRKPSLFAVAFCFHFFTLSNAANSSPTALKATTDVTGAANASTQSVAASTFSSSSFGPAILITYRFPLSRFFSVSDRTYPYFGIGTGAYYADLTVQPINNVANKYQGGGYGFVARSVLGFAVDLGADVGAFIEAQYAPLVYQSTGYVMQGQMHTMFAGFNYYFDAESSR